MVKESVPSSGAPFDLGKIRELIELMEQHGVTEVNLQRGEERWRLRRGPQEVVSMVPHGAYAAPVPMPMPAPPPPAAPAAPAAAAPAAAAAPSRPGLVIKSPTVGTFYERPSPADPPFVQVGSRVQTDTIVCLIEAMKVFNQIPAEVSGTIAEVLVSNGDAVEFGQPLFRVDPA